MTIEPTIDMQLVKDVITLPDIWERAAEDGIDRESFYPGTDAFTLWLLCKEEDDIIGIILIHVDNSVSLRLHPYLKSEHRGKGRVMMRAFYEWFLKDTVADINKINVSIPVYDNKLINFAKKVGFQKEGINRGSYRKDSKVYDLQNLGITRSEIEEYLKNGCSR